ncbi:MAG: alkaline phosphatase family protein [Planctomycetaceae bacterium]
MNTKHCILMVVDALAHRIVEQRFKAGNLPNLLTLVQRGGCLSPCTSIFPSITPAATCSIVTGCYPSQHGIEGACWFNRDTQEPAYFGDDLMVAWEQGLHQYLVDFGDRLNFERLCSPTLFETLHQHGIDSACINYMWFAGPYDHKRWTPLLLRLAAGKLSPTIRGPRYFKLGDFVETLPAGVASIPAQGIFGKYGFDDSLTSRCMMEIAKADALPPFTLAYFPTNDDASHQIGPKAAATEVLEVFDTFLGQWIEAIGGWQRIGADVELLIVGDHGQNGFRGQSPDVINLDDCLTEFQRATFDKGWASGDELFICPNMRASSIYLREESDELRQRIVARLLAVPTIDQVIYALGPSQWRIETARRGSLTFRRCGTGETPDAEDEYGNAWKLDGDLSCVDAQLTEFKTIRYGIYPNALERVAGANFADSNPIWVTACEGAEFRIQETRTHPGGSHGALWVDDSAAALLTSPGIAFNVLPCAAHPRIVDVATLVLHTLGVDAAASSNKGGAKSISI